DLNGLGFGRWYWQAPYLPQCGSIATTPHAERLVQLPIREQYAAMELWRGAMTCHSLIAYRSDAPARFVFHDDHWANYVPLRLPATLCVQERLPPGAAGVVLNRSHPFHDLVLKLNAKEKSIFDRIDGRRSIAELVNRDNSFDAHSFFHKLWSYDQVAFHAA